MSDSEMSLLGRVGDEIRESFSRNRRVLSFEDYFELVGRDPLRQARNAAQYLCDVFAHFGSQQVGHPRGGTVTRYRLFDVPFDGGRDRLVGHEDVQERVYRIFGNFVREGRANRLILLHGPNGSAKSTFASCLHRALEHYSTLDQGALYRINWIFPAARVAKGGIGFGFGGEGGKEKGRGRVRESGGDLDSESADRGREAGGRAPWRSGQSFAYLEDEQIDAKLADELHDHPLFLLPPRQRAEVLKELVARQGNGRPQSFALSDYILYGDLNHKNRLIYEALLSAYRGDYRKVLQHVQVERFYVSRRYRNASVVVEPQLAVDARLRQLTADRSLSALPSALQTINLWEYAGDLVDANRGLIEYSDLLKRPLEAYKYLLGTVENGAVALEGSNLFLDLVFIGSSNEGYLAAFKEVPEFQSFKGRMELVRVPYLLDYHVEELIYTPQVDPKAVGKHVAPHATEVASLWAVLTRMRKPQAEGYPKSISGVIDHLTPLDKAQLYALGQVPEGLSVEQSRELLAQREAIYGESEARGEARYEGRMGASPREIQTLLLNAAQSRHYACVTPLALFDEMEALCGATTVYEFLRQEPEPGGYHEHRRFVEMVRERFLDQVEEEVRTSMGLVDESQYTQLFERYIDHVSHFVRKEKLHNPVTRQLEDPDEELMREVEKTLGVSGKRDDFRQEAIGRIGAWSLSHPKEKPRYPEVFPKQFAKLRESYFEQHRKALRKLNQELLVYLTDGAEALEAEARERVELTLRNMRERFGYCDQCAKVAVGCLLRQRYAQ